MKKQPKHGKKPIPPKGAQAKKPAAPAKGSEEALPKQSFLKRLIFGEEKPDLSEIEAGSTTILDILSPTAVDTKSRDYIVVDGIFHAYLYITGYGYSTTVRSGWLSPLVEAGEGVSLNFIIKRQPKDKTLSKISQTTMINRSRMRDVGDTRQDYEELDSAIASGLYLKDVMNRQGEDFYYGKRPPAPFCVAAGYVEKLGYSWLHIQLNTLLPHCRYQPPLWLSDTIRRLLDNFEAGGNTVPYFRERAMLVIDEHSDVPGRRVFDQDNKGWKAVCNALKGRAIPDDDQYTLSVSLLATPSPENICHITLMDLRDASDFFALHSGDYALGSIYGCAGHIR